MHQTFCELSSAALTSDAEQALHQARRKQLRGLSYSVNFRKLHLRRGNQLCEKVALLGKSIMGRCGSLVPIKGGAK